MSTWLITGANRGIGFELTKQAVAAGHSVIATTRRPAEARDLNALAAKSGGKVEIMALEVSDATSVAALAGKLAGRPVHVLVNNAGIRPAERPALSTDFAAFANVLEINTLSPLRVTEALVPNLEAANGAKVLTITSMLGAFSFGRVEELGYCVSKTAVNRAMVLVADALKSKKIAVGLVSPGWVRTDMGGEGAPLSVEDSVRGLMQQIETLSLANTGSFRNYKGEPSPW
jgi:NAD(P)-dependent dehydrogenase (short-subunit alcohol dehydrogenase family)